jgi:predicted dehydrogenase
LNSVKKKYKEMDHTRRNFLKKGIVAGSVMLAPATLLNMTASSVSLKPKDKVRLGVIGTGSRAWHLMELMNTVKEQEGIEFTALCDVYEPNLEFARGLAPNAKVFTDYRSLLEMKELDAVIVATPLHQHAHITIDALNSGLHVFCEKAMARTMSDTYAMAKAHLETGKVLYVGHQRLFDPKFLKGMNMIHDGQLGKVTQIRAYWHRNNDWRRPLPDGRPDLERQINWRLYTEYSCGLMTELASHQIQIANWAKKALPIDVRGTGSISYWKDGREVHDNIALIYTYADGTQFIYDSMIQNRKYGLEEEILGDLGTLELESNRFYPEEIPEPPKPPGIVQLIKDISKGKSQAVRIGGASWEPETARTYKGEPVVAESYTDGTLEQMIAFADSVRNGQQIPGLLEQVYYGSVWTLLGQEAIDTGKVVAMPSEFVI